MAGTCPQCGEELLGNVNRCWRCGQPVASPAGAGELPPVRGDAIPLEQIRPSQAAQPVDAEPAETAALREEDGVPAAGGEPRAATGPDGAAAPGQPPPRPAGSPFDASVLPRRIEDSASHPQPRVPESSGNPAAAGAALASLFLGAVGVVASFLTPLAAVPATLGIPFGVWGLTSPRRKTAFAGILLCCAGMAFSGIHAVIVLRAVEILSRGPG